MTNLSDNFSKILMSLDIWELLFSNKKIGLLENKINEQSI